MLERLRRSAAGTLALAFYANPFWRRLGFALVAGLSLAFLAKAALEVSADAADLAIASADLALLVPCGLLYGALLILLAVAWALVPGGHNFRQAVAVYGISVMAKYVPGSVLQYGSRQVLGHRIGWSKTLMALASVLEIALHVLCSMLVAVMLGFIHGQFPVVGQWGLAIACLMLAAAFVAMRRLVGVAGEALTACTALQALFFAGLAGLAAACGAILTVPADAYLAVGSGFLIAWLAGFLVPVMPGGIGVREAAGVLLLSGAIGAEAALFIMVAMRIVTLLGDCTLFLLALACARLLPAAD